MLPRLRPGAHLLRRRDDQWQIGLDPARRVLLPGTGVRPQVLPATVPAGTVFRSALPPPDSCAQPVRQTLAAVAREAGEIFPAVLDRRAAHLVVVDTFGADGSVALGEELRALCERSGLRLPDPRPNSGADTSSVQLTPSELRSPPRPRRARDAVVAVVGVGEPSRESLDRHVREETPHLLVRLVEGHAVVGPFVVPGHTPCLRCVDASLTDADPSWPLLVEQYARAVRTGRPDGVPEPVDAALATLAVAWAARDLATWAEGGSPTTLASTVEIAPRLETVESREWSPHPRCGCSWR